MLKCKKPLIIKIHQGDDSDFNGNTIVFRIKTVQSLLGWRAKFQLQHLVWDFPDISSKEIKLVISKQQSESLEVGHHFGWLQYIDSSDRNRTAYSQEFLILPKEIH